MMVDASAALDRFREALKALVPIMNDARIPWKRPDSYDSWDEIATAMYRALVSDFLRWEVEGGDSEAIDIPPYDLMTKSCAGLWTVQVRHPSLSRGTFVFHALGTKDEPFDVVEVREVQVGGGLSEALTLIPYRGCEFRLSEPIQE